MSWREWFDFIVPTLSKLDKWESQYNYDRVRSQADELDAHIGKLKSNGSALRDFHNFSIVLLNEEDNRGAGIEAKLSAFFGHLSIASTLFIAVLLAIGTGSIHVESPWVKILFITATLYLMLQISVMIIAAIAGLAPTGFSRRNHKDFVPSTLSYNLKLNELITENFRNLESHRNINNFKAGHLKIAQRSMLNFVFGLVIFSITVAIALGYSYNGVKATAVSLPSNSFPHGSSEWHTSDYFPREIPAHDFTFKAPSLLGSLGFLLVLGGLGVILITQLKKRFIKGASLIASGIMLALIASPEVTFLKLDNFVIRLFDHLSLNKSPPISKPPYVVMNHILSIGPFPVGEHTLVNDRTITCMASALKPYQTSQLIGWTVVGSVDKRELRGKIATIYGSNQNLAMARGNWVRDFLATNNPDLDRSRIQVFNSGATVLGSPLNISMYDSDRKVDVYLMETLNGATDSSNGHSTKPAILCGLP